MSDIPDDVIPDILRHLPVKSLLQFRKVCKSWLRLIDSPNFIKKHLNWSIELKSSNVNAKLILNGDSSFYSVPLDSLHTHDTLFVNIDARMTKLNHPLKHDGSGTLVMGSCYGLILISNDVEGYGLWLWNPSTKKYRKLPCLKFQMPKERSVAYHAGLGYDRTTHDYKVVKIMQTLNMNNWPEVYAETMIFSLKSGSWKRIKDIPSWIIQGGVFALGALHWITLSANDEGKTIPMIVALDLGTEEHELVPFPVNWDVASQVDLGVLEGFLSMSCSYDFDRVDIWLMKDHGETKPWTKLLSVQRDRHWCMMNLKPIAYSSSGKHVLLEEARGQLLWYDLEKNSVITLLLFDQPRTFDAILCLESLAQLNGDCDDRIDKNTDVAEDKQRQNKRRDDFLSEGFKLKL